MGKKEKKKEKIYINLNYQVKVKEIRKIKKFFTEINL